MYAQGHGPSELVVSAEDYQALEKEIKEMNAENNRVSKLNMEMAISSPDFLPLKQQVKEMEANCKKELSEIFSCYRVNNIRDITNVYDRAKAECYQEIIELLNKH